METPINEGEALRAWLKQSRIPVSEVASRLEVSVQAVYDQFKKEVVSDSFKHKLSEAGFNFFKVKQAAPAENTFKRMNASPVTVGDEKLNLTIVPLKAQAGFMSGYEKRIFDDELQKIHWPFGKGEFWAFEVGGWSMHNMDDEDSVRPGDYVVTTEVDQSFLYEGKKYVFMTVEGSCYKIYDRIKNGLIYMSSANKEYNPVPEMPVKEVKKIFMKVSIIKK